MNGQNNGSSRPWRAAVIALAVALAAILRIAPHPLNLAPIGAMALFSGAMFRNRLAGFLFPLAALFAGDVFVGFHKLMPAVYASFAVSVAIGRWLDGKPGVTRLGGAVFLGAAQFFVVTNFALWAVGGFYPRTAAGLAACLAAGVPYFGNTLAGDALYASVLFGGFRLAERMVPALSAPEQAPGH
jgi:hypothetical protein